jgi:hypothetical protein
MMKHPEIFEDDGMMYDGVILLGADLHLALLSSCLSKPSSCKTRILTFLLLL